ncbi:MAG: LemA family protein [Bryobacterales bacterium]|nr:LemA family protein [Bryobacterales bacterium]MDE0623327.1 LemA family protein [Bryobacterales bacterium]
MKYALIAIGSLLLLALLLGGWFTGHYNSMVDLRENIRGSWAQVDNVIQRRADLIPNLVNTVKGFAAQEQEVIGQVTEARAALGGARTPSERIAANDMLGGALSRLLVVVENYPDLKSSQNFIRLQDELAGTENRIAVERRKYNSSVQAYNATIAKFPANVVASMTGFAREDAYFETDESNREAPPTVDFGAGG